MTFVVYIEKKKNWLFICSNVIKNFTHTFSSNLYNYNRINIELLFPGPNGVCKGLYAHSVGFGD